MRPFVRFRPKAPQAFAEVYQRALTQRFYVLSRTRSQDALEEQVELTGSTGNIYIVTIAHQPTCNCPHGAEGNQCKHQLYVLARVLHAKYEYVYQLALLSSELEEIFVNAPPPDSEGEEGSGDKDGKRKPLEGDCPICFCEMEEQGEQIVWCRAACGQNIHKGCFEMWAATKRKQAANAEVTCPYCRSVWQEDEDMVKKIKKNGKKSRDGYVNVADQLGISPVRGEPLSVFFVWAMIAYFHPIQITAATQDGGRAIQTAIVADIIEYLLTFRIVGVLVMLSGWRLGRRLRLCSFFTHHLIPRS